ncbi:unnamed protein product [Brassica oleracea var. botrytis]|uniref:MADS-box domain-containing protein n=1 Tax=Brassica oleracea TaxID=3712 RepID=A0A3P6F9P5_BRAOL|nr:unnamed protein product [Brassica oleracea]
MRKGKVVIKKLDDKVERQVTFAKRKKSLMKKARELSVLCDVPIVLIIFSQTDKLYSFCSQSTSMENLIMRYQLAKEGHAAAVDSFHPDHELYREETKESMMREIENLKMNLQLYGGGHGLNLLTYDDLLRFELQLESSLQNARARKFELMHQQQQKGRAEGKGKGELSLEIFMDEENQQFYHLGQGSSWEHLMWQAERQMMTCQREVEDDFMRRHMKEQFPFNVDEQPTGLLQLLRTPPSPLKP